MKEANKIRITDQDIKTKKVKFNAEVNSYINTNIVDNEYSKFIQDNPNELFSSMDNMKLALMELTLYKLSSPSGHGNDQKILSVELNLPEQNIIQNDCHRTRVRERFLIPDFEKILEKILTYYCQTKKIIYKQGLNEIFGVLLLLKYKIPTLKLSKIFDLGEVFIDRFSPNYFYEKEFYSLKSALGLFVILLRYHEPSVFNRLDQYQIVPEMYATNWMMTFLTGKIHLDLVYDYWLEIIKTEDPLIMHFFLVSLIKLKRELIINCDTNLLASLMSSLTIKNKEEIKVIFDMAIKLRQQTPYSFRILSNKLGFLKPKNSKVKEFYEKYHPQTIPAMPIFPLELLSLTHKSGIECVDPECKNSKNKFLSLISEEYCIIDKDEKEINILNFDNDIKKGHICEKCNMKIIKDIKYIMLDLRIKNDETDKTWFLPNVVEVEKEELLSPDFSRVITDRFIPERGIFHFIFLTSNTVFFSDFEKNFYTENQTEEEKLMIRCGIVDQTKIEKEINLEEVKNLTDKEKYYIKEYDNMRKALNFMQKENFPYVGFVLGGWKEIHEECFRQGIELVNHDREKCPICLEKMRKKNEKNKKLKEKKDDLDEELWKEETKIKYEELNKFLENENNFLCLCSIEEFQGKQVNYDVSILLRDESFNIEIYKFESRKHYKDILKEYDKDYIEKIKKNKDYYDLGKENNENIELTLIEKIKVANILGMKAEEKHKNKLNINYREDISDKKVSKKKGNNFVEKIIKVDFPTAKDTKTFIKAFKNLTTIYKSKIKNK